MEARKAEKIKSKRKLDHSGLMTEAVRMETQPSTCKAVMHSVILNEGRVGLLYDLREVDGHVRNVRRGRVMMSFLCASCQ